MNRNAQRRVGKPDEVDTLSHFFKCEKIGYHSCKTHNYYWYYELPKQTDATCGGTGGNGGSGGDGGVPGILSTSGDSGLTPINTRTGGHGGNGGNLGMIYG